MTGRILKHLIHGIWNHFPLCCVIQFSFEKPNKRYNKEDGYALNGWFYDTEAPWNKKGGEYIPCNRCISKYYKEVTGYGIS